MDIYKKTNNCVFLIILFFALSGCSGQTVRTEYYAQEVSSVHVDDRELDVTHTETGGSGIAHIEVVEEEILEDYTIAEAIKPTFDISLLVLQEVFYRDGLIHILDNDGQRGLLDGMGNLLIPLQSGVTFGGYGYGDERILVITSTGAGFLNTVTGEWVIPPTLSLGWQHNPSPSRPYASAGIFRHGTALVHLENQGSGVLNRDGEWVFEPGSRMPSQHLYGFFTINQGGRSVIVNAEGERVFPLPHMENYHTAEHIRFVDYNLIRLSVNRDVKFFDLEGNQVGGFSDLSLSGEGYAHHRVTETTIQNGIMIEFYSLVSCQTTVDTTAEYRAFDMWGNQITNRYYTSIGRFIEGFAPVEIGRPTAHMEDDSGNIYVWNDTYGFIDEQGNIWIGCHWTEGRFFYNWDDVFWGLIDTQGNEIIPLIYWNLSHVLNGRLIAYSPRGFALLNTTGEYVIPFGLFEHITICDQGLVVVRTGGVGTSPSNQLKGLVGLDGNEIIPPRYNIIRSYWTHNYMVWGWEAHLREAGLHSHIHPVRVNSPQTPPTFIEGRAAVAYDGLWGYMDINGNEIIPLQFVYAGTFIDGVALVNVGGTRAKPNTWQSCWSSCIADVRHYSAFGGVWHLIDAYGNIIETFEHEFMKRVSANILAFSNDISLSEPYDRFDWRGGISHRGGRFTPLWDELGCIYFRLWGDDSRILYNRCVYITLVQMNLENFGILVIEPLPITELLHEAIFTQVQYFEGFVYVQEGRLGQNNGQSYRFGGLLDALGNELIPMTQDLSFHPQSRHTGWYQGITHELSDGILVASTAYGTGYIDSSTGEWIAFFPHVQEGFNMNTFFPFAYGVAIVGTLMTEAGGPMKVINRDGEQVFEIASGHISPRFRYGLAVVEEGILDESGEFVRWWSYVINTDGEIVFPLLHMEIYQHTGSIGILSPNLFQALVHRRNFSEGQIYEPFQRVFDLDGNVFFYYFDENHSTDDLWWHEYHNFVSRFFGGYASFQTGFYQWMGVNALTGLFPIDVYTGLINEQGQVVIPPRYDIVSRAFHGRVVAELGVWENIWNRDEAILSIALLNTSGEYIIPAERFHRIFLCLAEPIAVVAVLGEYRQRQYGIVDLYGNYIIHPIYDIIRHYGIENHHTRFFHGSSPEPIFIEGRAIVANGGLWGFVDINGYEIIPTQFEYVGIFMNGTALVNYGGNWQLIDLYGNILESFEHEFMTRLNANLLTFTEGERTGIIKIIR